MVAEPIDKTIKTGRNSPDKTNGGFKMLEKIAKALGEELSAKVDEALKKAGIEVGVTNDGTFVPAEKHEALKVELKQAKVDAEGANAKLKEVNTQLEEMSKNKDNSEATKEQLSKLKKDFDDYKIVSEKKVADVRKQAALERQLLAEKANPDALDYLVGLVNLDEVEVKDDGTIKDVDKVLKPLKEGKKSLFAETVIKGGDVHKGGKSDPAEPNDWQEKYNAAKTNLDRIKVKQAAAAEGVIIEQE